MQVIAEEGGASDGALWGRAVTCILGAPAAFREFDCDSRVPLGSPPPQPPLSPTARRGRAAIKRASTVNGLLLAL